MAAKQMSGSSLNIPSLKLTEAEKDVVQESPVAEEVTTEPVEEEINFNWYPVTEDAHAWLVEKREGCHAFINYFSKGMASMVAKTLNRQLTLNEIKFFVGLDGEVNSATCFIRSRQIGVEISNEIAQIEAKRDQQIAEINVLDPSLYGDDIKNEEIEKISSATNEEIERLKDELQDPAGAYFTPVWVVVPWMNPRLLDELKESGDVLRSFMAGDRLNMIYRSGCIYETDKGSVEFGGSMFFFDQDMKMVRIATSPLGLMSVIHPKAGNPKDAVRIYFGKGGEARRTQLKQIFGISNKELERREKVRRSGAKGGEIGDRLVFRMEDTMLALFGEQRVTQAKPKVGAGCSKKK